MPVLVGGGLHARPVKSRWRTTACCFSTSCRNSSRRRSQVRSNAAVAGAILEDVARPDGSGLTLLREAADAMRLSARGYHRVLRVARTLADLDGADKVGRVHLAEALSYRALADEIRRAA
jgi:predicted ATPase with chaperone activity